MLTQAGMAKKIRNLTLKQFHRQKADMLSTTNIGCALHIQAGLDKDIEVTHPVALLIRQLDLPA